MIRKIGAKVVCYSMKARIRVEEKLYVKHEMERSLKLGIHTNNFLQEMYQFDGSEL